MPNNSSPPMDFPEAWAFVRETKLDSHDPKCSYRTCQGGMLCDCFILNDEYERRKFASAPASEEAAPTDLIKADTVLEPESAGKPATLNEERLSAIKERIVQKWGNDVRTHLRLVPGINYSEAEAYFGAVFDDTVEAVLTMRVPASEEAAPTDFLNYWTNWAKDGLPTSDPFQIARLAWHAAIKSQSGASAPPASGVPRCAECGCTRSDRGWKYFKKHLRCESTFHGSGVPRKEQK